MWHSPTVFAFDSQKQLRPIWEEHISTPTIHLEDLMNAIHYLSPSYDPFSLDDDEISSNERFFANNTAFRIGNVEFVKQRVCGEQVPNLVGGGLKDNEVKDEGKRKEEEEKKEEKVEVKEEEKSGKKEEEAKKDGEENEENEEEESNFEEIQSDDPESVEADAEATEGIDFAHASPETFKLNASKSPIIDALVFCALKGWGIKLLCNKGSDIKFQVMDLDKYYEYSAKICAKQNPTEDQSSRVKALKRWFPDFPSKRDRVSDSFVITVTKGSKKDNKPQKMHKIIERNMKLLGIRKVRRQK